MGANRNSFTFDSALLLKAAGLVAATANGSIILDIGEGLVDGYLVIDMSACEIDSGNELYTISLEASNASDMASGSVCVARKTFGTISVPMDNALSAAGRYVIPFRNEEAGTTYRYIRVHTTVAGTVATGINYSAFIAMDD